jgi:hypothetical protein
MRQEQGEGGMEDWINWIMHKQPKKLSVKLKVKRGVL